MRLRLNRPAVLVAIQLRLMRRAISITLATGLVIIGSVMMFTKFGFGVQKFWIAGPFLAAVGLMWLYDDICRH